MDNAGHSGRCVSVQGKYGYLRVQITGTKVQLRRGLEVLKSISLGERGEHLLKKLADDWALGLARAEQVKAGRLDSDTVYQFKFYHFWDVVSIPATALYHTGLSVRDLGIRIGFYITDLQTGDKYRMTLNKPREELKFVSMSSGWDVGRIFSVVLTD